MQLTSNTRPFIEAEVYSSFILTQLHDGLLGESFYRDVSGELASGDTLHIKTIGTVAIQETTENTPLTYTPIESGEITFQITEQIGDAWYVTDDLREDGTSVDALMSARSVESTRAIQEKFETDFLATAGNYYLAGGGAGDPNLINGQPHLIPSTGTNNAFELSQLIQLKLSFQKANVPLDGVVIIVDPIVEATLNSLVTITSDVTEFAKQIIQGGMASGQRFICNLYGFDIMTSNRLPTGSISDGTTTITNSVVNLAMCVLDDNCKPVIGAWRRMPKVEGERNKDLRRDEYVTTCRYGFGIQRVDTLAALPTSATAISN